MAENKTFLLVDDHSLITQALTMLLKSDNPANEVFAANDAAAARRLVQEHGEDADLLILDLAMPGVTGTALLEEFVGAHPSLKILVLSGHVERENIIRALQLGAAGFVPKTLDAGLLLTAIGFVLRGGVYLPSSIIEASQRSGFLAEAAKPREPEEPACSVQLTPRQTDVLRQLARGGTVRQIGQKLGLSEGTVKTHLAAIYRTLGVGNRTEALLAAHRAGLGIKI